MTLIERSALVGYTSKQMFELVNHIEAYPEFLPWCKSSEVMAQSDHEIEASLQIAWSGIHKSFTTRNALIPYEKIKMTLVDGPLSRLEGEWTFTAVGDSGCQINLVLEFEVPGGIMSRVIQPLFNNIANSLVERFCKRADEVYGQSNKS